jgi:hypothetical protein
MQEMLDSHVKLWFMYNTCHILTDNNAGDAGLSKLWFYVHATFSLITMQEMLDSHVKLWFYEHATF